MFENHRKWSHSTLPVKAILSGQKFIKNDKNGQFGDFLKTRSLRSNSVTRYVTLKRTLVENSKIQMQPTFFKQF